LLFVLGGFIFVFLLNFREAYRIGKAILVEQPSDAILLDIGKALLESLKETGFVSLNLQKEYVRVVEQPDGSYRVLLDYASPNDSAVFSKAYREIFEPVRNQRYLILRDDGRLPNFLMGTIWAVVRIWFRDKNGYKPAYHPVPQVLAARKEYALVYARHWGKYVGGGKLIFTRGGQGYGLLLKARSQKRPKVDSMAFEIWR